MFSKPIKSWVAYNLVVNCRFTELGSNDPGSSDVPHASGNCVCTHDPSGCQSLYVQLPAYPHSLVIAPVRERSADHHHPYPRQSSCCRQLTGKHKKKFFTFEKNLYYCPTDKGLEDQVNGRKWWKFYHCFNDQTGAHLEFYCPQMNW